jgi:DNA repair exonuclease SbcCD nuclease subunit
MKFAHMADCHIGAWRDPKLKDLPIQAFVKALHISQEQHVDFIIIAGDLFNTALPGIDNLKTVVKSLKELKEANIPVYIIPGSHDFSPSGKTMIDVLEEAGLVVNVVKGTAHDGKLRLKFTVNTKTDVKITGMLGKAGILEKHYYEVLDHVSLEHEQGKKIFIFHGPVRELMGMEFSAMDAYDLSFFPKGFEYYAGGHVHIVKEYSDAHYKNVVYPGPLFPASFSELEKLGCGGFFIYDNGKIRREEINIKNVFKVDIDADHATPEEIEAMIDDKISNKEFLNTIVLMRIAGKMKTGKTADIKFSEIFRKIYAQGAFSVMRNTSKLISEEYEEIKIDEKTADDVEDMIIREHLQQIKMKGLDSDKEYRMTKELIMAFEQEKHEGEKVYEYEDRVRKEADRLLDV